MRFPLSSAIPVRPSTPWLLTLGLMFSVVTAPTQAMPATTVGGPALKINAQKQQVNLDTHEGAFEGNVRVVYQDMTLTSQQAKLRLSPTNTPEEIQFYNSPKLFQTVPGKGTNQSVGDLIIVTPPTNTLTIEGNSQTVLNTIADGRVVIKAHQQRYDGGRQLMTASGNVHVDYKALKIDSQEAAVFLTPDKKPRQITFQSGVVITEPDRTLRANRVVYNPNTKNVSAEGNVVSRAKDKGKGQTIEVQSDYQHFDDASKTMIAGGHVRMKMEGYTAVGPKAIYNMNTAQLTFTGRSTIREAGRQVTADKIVIKTKPRRTFEASGNVETLLLNAKKGATTNPLTPGSKPSSGNPNTPSKPPQPAAPLTEEDEFKIP